jgi:hypothetical protein
VLFLCYWMMHEVVGNFVNQNRFLNNKVIHIVLLQNKDCARTPSQAKWVDFKLKISLSRFKDCLDHIPDLNTYPIWPARYKLGASLHNNTLIYMGTIVLDNKPIPSSAHIHLRDIHVHYEYLINTHYLVDIEMIN